LKGKPLGKKGTGYDGNVVHVGSREAKKRLKQLPRWTLVGDSIEKEFKFRNYLAGLRFANFLGRTAEKKNHHPDILIRWKRVMITLSTHDIRSLSAKDFIMAAEAEKAYKKVRNDELHR
jgi:4a-hydroxytetrahydrobiopterin dehydratase